MAPMLPLPIALDFAPDAVRLVKDVAALPFPGAEITARHALSEVVTRALLWAQKATSQEIERAIAALCEKPA